MGNFLIEPFKDGNYVIGIMFWVMFLVVLAMVVGFLIYIVDSTFMPVQKANGIITKKKKVDAHTTTTFVKVGNILVPQTRHHKDAYYVKIEIDGIKDSVNVKKKYYDQVVIGDTVECEYTRGRLFTDSLYIDKII